MCCQEKLYFTCSLQLVFKTHAPSIEKRAKGGLCPKLDINAIKLMDRPSQTSRKARKSKSNDDWKTYRTLRKKCNKKLKKANSNHLKEARNDNMNKQKKFWSQIKSVFPQKSQSMANVSTDKRPILNILSRFYSTMASKLKKSTYLQILSGVILQILHIKLRKNLDFRVFQYCLYKKSYNCWRQWTFFPGLSQFWKCSKITLHRHFKL